MKLPKPSGSKRKRILKENFRANKAPPKCLYNFSIILLTFEKEERTPPTTTTISDTLADENWFGVDKYGYDISDKSAI